VKLGEIAKVKSKKKYICIRCENTISIDEIGIVGNGEFAVCKECAPIIDKRRAELFNTFIAIHSGYPTQENIDAINKLALQIGG
jgi:hypothetical protein